MSDTARDQLLRRIAELPDERLDCFLLLALHAWYVHERQGVRPGDPFEPVARAYATWNHIREWRLAAGLPESGRLTEDRLSDSQQPATPRPREGGYSRGIPPRDR